MQWFPPLNLRFVATLGVAAVGAILGRRLRIPAGPLLLPVDLLTAYLATSPGGLDTVAIIAAGSQVNISFVMAMARFISRISVRRQASQSRG